MCILCVYIYSVCTRTYTGSPTAASNRRTTRYFPVAIATSTVARKSVCCCCDGKGGGGVDMAGGVVPSARARCVAVSATQPSPAFFPFLSPCLFPFPFPLPFMRSVLLLLLPAG